MAILDSRNHIGSKSMALLLTMLLALATSPKGHLLCTLRESAFLFGDDVKMGLPRTQSSYLLYSLSSSLAMK